MKQIISFILVISAIFAQFDWQDQGIPIRQGDHIEWQRTGDKSDNGTMIFVWSDTRTGGRDIYAQKVDANGNSLWDVGGAPVVEVPISRQEDPILVNDGAGGAFIIWIDYRDEPEDGDIYGQHILSDGSLDWDPSGVPLSTVPGKQVAPNMCVDGLGGAFAIWDDKSVGAEGHIYATHLSADGGILAPGVGIPIISSEGAHSKVSIEVSGEGYAVMVWEQWGLNEFTDLYAQKIDTDCNTLWTAPEVGGVLICDADNFQYKPKVNDVNDAVSAIVWQDSRAAEIPGSSGVDIYIQYVDADGTILLGENGEVVCDADGSQINPRVKADANSTYIVWEDYRNDLQWSDIYAQRYTVESGAMWENNGKPISTEGHKKYAPRLTTDSFGGVYIVWMDERTSDYPEVDIYLQHLMPDGNISFENELVICGASNFQFNPLVRPDDSGNAIVVWGDMRSGSIGLYVQHVDHTTGISLNEDGEELFWGLDGNISSINSLYLGNDNMLFYWQDNRFGGEHPTTFGQLIDNNSNLLLTENGVALSLNSYQENPHAVLLGENIFLSYKSKDQWGTVLQYYQILDLNLNPVGDPNGTPVYDAAWLNQDFSEMIVGEDGYVYFVWSEMRSFSTYNDLFVQKYDALGNPQWAFGGIILAETSNDDIVQSVQPLPGEGAIVIWQGGPWDDMNIFATAIDGDGNFAESWGDEPVNVSIAVNHQSNAKTIATPDEVFIIWKDTRSGVDADLFGQIITNEGVVIGTENGFPISEKINDQQTPSLSFNQVSDEILICWEDFESGEDFDIVCRSLASNDLEMSDEIMIAGQNDEANENQNEPFICSAPNGVNMIAWEYSQTDSSATDTTAINLPEDIYYQEYTDSFITPEFTSGGVEICTMPFRQTYPKFGQYSETESKYAIIWEDHRSTGKEWLINLYAQSRTLGCYCSMDPNDDGSVDVLDVVMAVSFILGSADPTPEEFIACDTNCDGSVDVLDAVAIVSYIINQ